MSISVNQGVDQGVALKVLGRRKKKCKGWISTESWKKIEERRKLKKKIGDSQSERLKNKARVAYREKDKEVKRSLRKDKRDWINGVAQEAEDAASQMVSHKKQRTLQVRAK